MPEKRTLRALPGLFAALLAQSSHAIPQISTNGEQMTIAASGFGGGLTINVPGATCTGSDLCGLVGRVSNAETSATTMMQNVNTNAQTTGQVSQAVTTVSTTVGQLSSQVSSSVSSVVSMAAAMAVRCSADIPSSATNASITYPPERLVGTTAQLSCSQGFDLNGPLRVACLSTGQWDTSSLSQSSCTVRQCPVEFGNDLIQRSAADGATDINFVDVSQCFTEPGNVTSISFFAGRTPSPDIGQVFRVWRRINQYTFRQVYKTDPIVNSQPPQSVVTYQLPQVWAVQPGDCPGWYHLGPGTLFYNGGGDVVVWQYAGGSTSGNNAADPGIGGTKQFNTGQWGLGARTYSYQFAFAPNLCLV